MASATAPARTRGRPPGEWQNQLPSDLFDDAAFCSLNAPQRLILIDCIRRADRHGRGMARPSQVRTTALDGLGLSVEQTAGLLADVPGLMAGSKFELLMYEVDRNQFYAFPRWLEFQNIEYVPKSSRFPPPPGCTDDEPPSTPPGTDGSADLPPAQGKAAGVPTTGAAPVRGVEQKAEPTQGGADPSAGARARQATIEQARRSPQYREYEEACREAELDRWLTPMAFETLFTVCLETKRDWQVVIEAVKETGRGAAGGKAPSPRYGARIIRELPPHIRTRGEARAYLEDPERKPPATGTGQPRGRPKSNVFLQREKRDPTDYDYIYKKFDGPDPDPKPPPEATEVN